MVVVTAGTGEYPALDSRVVPAGGLNVPERMEGEGEGRWWLRAVGGDKIVLCLCDQAHVRGG